MKNLKPSLGLRICFLLFGSFSIYLFGSCGYYRTLIGCSQTAWCVEYTCSSEPGNIRRIKVECGKGDNAACDEDEAKRIADIPFGCEVRKVLPPMSTCKACFGGN